MKAKTQYNDMKGVVAGDISDCCYNDLQQFLINKFPSYNSKKYTCVGCNLFVGESNSYVKYICKDNDGNYVTFQSEKKQSLESIFSAFKRLDIVIANNIEDIPQEVENIYLSNKKDIGMNQITTLIEEGMAINKNCPTGDPYITPKVIVSEFHNDYKRKANEWFKKIKTILGDQFDVYVDNPGFGGGTNEIKEKIEKQIEKLNKLVQ